MKLIVHAEMIFKDHEKCRFYFLEHTLDMEEEIRSSFRWILVSFQVQKEFPIQLLIRYDCISRPSDRTLFTVVLWYLASKLYHLMILLSHLIVIK